jgi:hypothetical protein
VRTLPEQMIRALTPFAPLFSKRGWRHVQVLVAGAIFQPPEGTRTSSNAQIVCLRQEEEAPPPTNSAEALNRYVLTRVLTPMVAT